jgi:hypothetical protein
VALDRLREFLIWSTVINYAVLLVWFVAFVYAHDGLYRLHGHYFRLSVERFDALHYAGMASYKVGILLLNLVPLLALLIIS